MCLSRVKLPQTVFVSSHSCFEGSFWKCIQSLIVLEACSILVMNFPLENIYRSKRETGEGIDRFGQVPFYFVCLVMVVVVVVLSTPDCSGLPLCPVFRDHFWQHLKDTYGSRNLNLISCVCTLHCLSGPQ